MSVPDTNGIKAEKWARSSFLRGADTSVLTALRLVILCLITFFAHLFYSYFFFVPSCWSHKGETAFSVCPTWVQPFTHSSCSACHIIKPNELISSYLFLWEHCYTEKSSRTHIAHISFVFSQIFVLSQVDSLSKITYLVQLSCGNNLLLPVKMMNNRWN